MRHKPLITIVTCFRAGTDGVDVTGVGGAHFLDTSVLFELSEAFAIQNFKKHR